MAAILPTLTTFYDSLLKSFPGDPDPRTTDLFLMSSIWIIFSVLFLYVILIYWIGPKWMENKEPFNIYPYLVWHNTFLVTTNVLLGTGLLVALTFTRYNMLCEPVHKEGFADNAIAYLIYATCLLKIFELLDALYLVAKKLKPPFILIFHHSTIVLIVWLPVKYAPGGSATFPLLLNSFVHVLVYLHFKYSKRWMSPMQSRKMFIVIYFIQFAIVSILSSTCLYLDCGYPRWMALLGLTYNLILISVYSKTLLTLLCTPPASTTVITPEEDSTSSESSDDQVKLNLQFSRRKRK